MDIDKIIRALENKILALMSMEDVSATKLCSLCRTLLLLYAYKEGNTDVGDD